MSNYVPLIFKPRTMFTKGLFFISDARLPIVKSYGWAKYLEKKYSGEELVKFSTGGKFTFMGNVYEFDFKSCWEDHYNGKYDGISFGQFKRLFYNGELKGIDKEIFSERMILNLEVKYGNSFDWALNMFVKRMDLLKAALDDMKMSNKRYTAHEIVEIMCKKDETLPKTKYRNIMETLLSLLSTYDSNINFGRREFCKYNSQTERYQIDSPYYYRVITKVKSEIEAFLRNCGNNTKKQTLVDISKHKSNQMRNDPLLIAVQIMELMDLATYTCEIGNRPEFFVRINSEKLIRKILEDKGYQSRTLASIHLLHHNSVRYMRYFFEKLHSDKERWQFIEDYFMGRVEERYDIGFENVRSGSKNSDVYVKNSKNVLEETKQKHKQELNMYIVYHEEDECVTKYYISENKVEALELAGAVKISPDCAAAKRLKISKVGDQFDINGYSFLVKQVECQEL